MKICFLSGAYKNAGDFLIEDRAIKLIMHVLPEANIVKLLRNKISDNIDIINQCDSIVFGGGPIYMENLRDYLPLNELCTKVSKPMMILGGGYYNSGAGDNQMHHYRFDDDTLAFLRKVDSGYGLSCRDMQTYCVLRDNGLKNVYLTGCPAWYELSKVEKSDFLAGDIKEIVISDPAWEINYAGCVKVINLVREIFRGAHIRFAFHRGIPKGATVTALFDCLKDNCIDYFDISNSLEGFEIYDSADLHIGYRVHAHIYSLSIRHRSILIEEDGRGAGVNQTLGIPRIKAYNDSIQTSNALTQKVFHRTSKYPNRYLTNDLENYINILESTDYMYIRSAFDIQKAYFSKMKDFISLLK